MRRGKLILIKQPESDEEKAEMVRFMGRTRGASLYEVCSTKTKYHLPWHPNTPYRVDK